MNRILFFFVSVITVISSYGQTADGRYVSRRTQDGILYFINPYNLKKLSGIKKFEYDMTMLTWTDSITINFTFESNIMSVPSEVKITSGNKTFQCTNYSSLYIDIKKNHYEIRITSKFPRKDIEHIISSAVPPIFILRQDNQEESATYKIGAWKKERKKLSDIYQLYLYSK